MELKPLYRLEGVQPILAVTDITVSRAFYVDILGFTEEKWGNDHFTSIKKDGGAIYLCRGAQGQSGTWLWLGFEGNIYELHDRLLAEGVPILLPPTNYPWALEMHVKDPDGHVLRFGTDPDNNKPFAAE